MTETPNHEIRLKTRPQGQVTPALFERVEVPVPVPGDGQVLLRVLFLSLDPAMRGWIADAPNYRDPVPLGAVMPGFTVSEVVASNHPDYAVGEIVAGRQGWREWALSDGSDIDRKLDPEAAPVSTSMHILGHTGLTAYLGLLETGQAKEGETVVVSTAAGAVGSVVGQIAKIKGCRTVGLTGSDDKVRDCYGLYGYDAVINYRSVPDLEAAIGEACPDGVDVYYDNVGGAIADAVMPHLNVHARVVVVGTMAIDPGGATADDPPPMGPRPNRHLLVKRARMEGFLVLDHLDRMVEAVEEMSGWLRSGRLAYREDVTNGLEAAPGALVRLLKGENTGKVLVRVGEEPPGV